MFRKFLFFTMFITIYAQTTFGAAAQPAAIYEGQLFDVFGLTGQNRSCIGLGEILCQITKLNQNLNMHIIFQGYSLYLFAGWNKLCATEANNERCTYISQLESSLTGLLKLIKHQSPESGAIIALEELIQQLEQNRPHEFNSPECKLHFSLQEMQFQLENLLAEKTEIKNNYEEKFLAILGFNTDTLALTEITNKICSFTGFNPELLSPIFCGFLGTLHWNIVGIDNFVENSEKFATIDIIS